MICTACGGVLAGKSYFSISRVGPNGAVRDGAPAVTTCSLICIIKWSYAETAQQGVALAMGAKGALDQLMDVLRGGR